MNVLFVLFLVLPPVLLLAKDRLPLRLRHGWALTLAFAVVGYALLNTGVWWHFESLSRQVTATAEPSNELLDRNQTDGAQRVFALYFGWAYALAYFAVWWGGFHLSRRIRERRGA